MKKECRCPLAGFDTYTRITFRDTPILPSMRSNRRRKKIMAVTTDKWQHCRPSLFYARGGCQGLVREGGKEGEEEDHRTIHPFLPSFRRLQPVPLPINESHQQTEHLLTSRLSLFPSKEISESNSPMLIVYPPVCLFFYSNGYPPNPPIQLFHYETMQNA